MPCPGYPDTFDLADGETLEIRDGQGTTLRVTRGAVWLTMEHDTRDIVLSAGDSFVVDRPGLTLVAAQAATTLCAIAVGDVRRAGRESAAGVFAGAWRRLVAIAERRRRGAVAYY
jgi:hypothetical protein